MDCCYYLPESCPEILLEGILWLERGVHVQMRLGWPPLPREHGAWAMLITPPVIALLVEGYQPLGILAAGGWVVGYALRGPLEVLMGRGASGRAGMAVAEPEVARLWLLLLGLLSVLLFMPVFWVRPMVLLLLAAAALLLLTVFWLTVHGKGRSLLSGLLAVAGLMAGAPLYDLAATAAVGPQTWAITFASFAFFAGSVFRVKVVGRERRHSHFRLLSVGVHLALVGGAWAASAMGWAPSFLVVPLLPPLVMAGYGIRRAGAGPVNLGAVGKAEVWLTLLFAVLLILIMQ